MGNHIILDREYIFRLTQAKEEKDLIELKKLHAHAQLISSIEVNALRSLINLKILDISHNYLTDLDPQVFKPLINVEKIKLQNNKLASIDPFIFKNLRKLRKIHLYWNKLSNDSLELFLEPSCQYVSFRSDGFIKNDIKLIVSQCLSIPAYFLFHLICFLLEKTDIQTITSTKHSTDDLN
jgi:hypothetical protein